MTSHDKSEAVLYAGFMLFIRAIDRNGLEKTLEDVRKAVDQDAMIPTNEELSYHGMLIVLENAKRRKFTVYFCFLLSDLCHLPSGRRMPAIKNHSSASSCRHSIIAKPA